MATVQDYASLAQAVNDWFVRTDLTGKVDYFIQMAEQSIYTDIITQNDGQGVQAMEATFSAAIQDGGTLPLPAGYLGLKYALVSACSGLFELPRKTPEFIYTRYPWRGGDGVPAYIARDGQNFVFGPSPDSDYTVQGIYWMRAAPLSSSNTTTWMTSTIPTILLAATCRAAATMLRDQDQLAVWQSAYTDQMASFILTSKAEELSGSTLAMTPA